MSRKLFLSFGWLGIPRAWGVGALTGLSLSENDYKSKKVQNCELLIVYTLATTFVWPVTDSGIVAYCYFTKHNWRTLAEWFI